MKFLVDCCKAILHDMTPGGLIKGHDIAPTPGLFFESADWSSIATIAAEAPYRLPAQVNFH